MQTVLTRASAYPAPSIRSSRWQISTSATPVARKSNRVQNPSMLSQADSSSFSRTRICCHANQISKSHYTLFESLDSRPWLHYSSEIHLYRDHSVITLQNTAERCSGY